MFNRTDLCFQCSQFEDIDGIKKKLDIQDKQDNPSYEVPEEERDGVQSTLKELTSIKKTNSSSMYQLLQARCKAREEQTQLHWHVWKQDCQGFPI